MHKKAMRLHSGDNSAVAVEEIYKGENVEIVSKGMVEKTIVALADIPFGFKISVEDIPVNETIIKYGQVIGKAACNVSTGEMLHIHNMKGLRA